MPERNSAAEPPAATRGRRARCAAPARHRPSLVMPLDTRPLGDDAGDAPRPCADSETEKAHRTYGARSFRLSSPEYDGAGRRGQAVRDWAAGRRSPPCGISHGPDAGRPGWLPPYGCRRRTVATKAPLSDIAAPTRMPTIRPPASQPETNPNPPPAAKPTPKNAMTRAARSAGGSRVGVVVHPPSMSRPAGRDKQSHGSSRRPAVFTAPKGLGDRDAASPLKA